MAPNFLNGCSLLLNTFPSFEHSNIGTRVPNFAKNCSQHTENRHLKVEKHNHNLLCLLSNIEKYQKRSKCLNLLLLTWSWSSCMKQHRNSMKEYFPLCKTDKLKHVTFTKHLNWKKVSLVNEDPWHEFSQHQNVHGNITQNFPQAVCYGCITNVWEDMIITSQQGDNKVNCSMWPGTIPLSQDCQQKGIPNPNSSAEGLFVPRNTLCHLWKAVFRRLA